MNKEQFEKHCAELDRLAEAGKWKNAFEELVHCYLASQYKEKWEHYDPDFDYENYAQEVIEGQGYIHTFADVEGVIPCEQHFHGED